jgi:hypothetical protein
MGVGREIWGLFNVTESSGAVKRVVQVLTLFVPYPVDTDSWKKHYLLLSNIQKIKRVVKTFPFHQVSRRLTHL